MKNKALLAVIISLFMAGTTVAQDGFIDGVDLTTIKAPWTIRILGNDLDISNVQTKPDDSSGYFMMRSGSTELNVSIFIEPIDKCKAADECRDYVLNLGNPAWGKFQELKKGTIGGLSYFEFYRPEIRGQPIKMFDMYAEYVGDGYWVDVHISKAEYDKEDRFLFEKLIESIKFVKKTEISRSPFDSQLAKTAAASTSWLEIWNSPKCSESYLRLSTVTRQEIPEKTWADYCQAANQGLGKRKSRQMVAAAFTKSLPGKTDRPVAILAYHSGFEKRTPVVELLALMLERDDSWVTTNYIAR